MSDVLPTQKRSIRMVPLLLHALEKKGILLLDG